ncbi:MAG: hypothetical protein R3F43_16440 [bacterium]
MSAETESSVGKRVRDALRFVRDGAVDTDAKDFSHHVEQAHRALQGACGEAGEVTLAVATNRINLDDEVVYRSEAQDANLAFDLFKQGLRRITFQAGIKAEEVSAFIRALAECRDATSSDQDFISTLWQEELEHVRYVAIDGFTEKLFMSEEIFTRRFRGRHRRRHAGPPRAAGGRTTATSAGGSTPSSTTTTPTRRGMRRSARPSGAGTSGGGAGRAPAHRAWGTPALDHLVRLLGSVLVKDPQPIDDRGLAEVVHRIYQGYLEARPGRASRQPRAAWVASPRPATAFPAVARRLEGLLPAVAGGAAAELCADHMAGCEPGLQPLGAVVLHRRSGPHRPRAAGGDQQLRDSRKGPNFLRNSCTARARRPSIRAERLRDPNPGRGHGGARGHPAEPPLGDQPGRCWWTA